MTKIIDKPHFDKVVYALENPKYHLFHLNKVNQFSGWVFYFGEKTVTQIHVYGDNKLIDHFPVNGLREDVQEVAPGISDAGHSGFEFEIDSSKLTTNLTFELEFDDKSRELWFEFDIAEIIAQQDYLCQLKNKIAAIPKPAGNIVFLTQGHHHADEYQNSIVPGVLNMQKYLSVSGVELDKVKTLLDFGCGSGRFLVGWHLTYPHIELHGCDINKQLISWAETNLPAEIKCIKSNLMPPLAHQDNQFDIIYLISVFTHLSLDAQTAWIEELSRIIKVGGHILLTLHGELYVRNNFSREPDKIASFLDSGFIQQGHASIEGENSYSAFHLPKFIATLFDKFKIVGYFPNGQINHQRTLSPIAHFQDVYVLQYQGE